jgi:hypothetical protein
MTASATIADAARAFHERGWKPVPISRRTKRPIGKEWQKRPYDPAQFNDNAQNVGLQLGEVSGGLADVDLDTLTAIGFAPEFLPATNAIFGHRSKPMSHQLYVSDLYKTEARAAIQYKRFLNGRQGETIVELRIGGNQGKGIATVAPPSIHAGTGEPIAWVSEGEPAQVDGAELMRAVRKLAVASLLKPHYPGQGSRHDGALVIGGVLARAAWSADDIRHVVEVVARAVGDEEVANRITTAAGAVSVKANGNDVAGFERLRAVWGEEVADTLKHWLKARELRSDKGVGIEDSVALDFAAKHADGLRYIARSSQWMHWTGTYWREEETLAAFDEARKLRRPTGDARAKTVSAVTTLARSDRRIAATTEQWDAGATLFNTRKKE